MTAIKTTRRRGNLTEGPVEKHLFRLAWPMFFGIVAVRMFNVVDTYFVGQLGAHELAALSFTFPVVFFITSISLGLGVGTSSVISRAIGEGDKHKVRRLTTDSLILSVIIVTSLALTGLFTLNPMFRLMGATDETIVLIGEYMVIIYLGLGLLVVPMVGNAAIRATGDTRSPSVVMIIAGTVNVILDPILIFGWGPIPRLEIKGAALASIGSWSLTLVASLWILGRREKMLDFGLPKLREMIQSWREILYIGIPAAGTNVLIPLSIAIILRFISGYGTEAVAAYGVATRLESLALIGVFALASGLAPFVGQNYGAQLCDRVRLGLKTGFKYSLVWTATMAVVLAAFAHPLASLFNDSPGVVAGATTYLWMVPISYVFLSVAFLVSTTFNAARKPFQASIIVLVRLFVLAIPLAWIGSSVWGLAGIFGGIAVANVGVGIFAYIRVKFFMNQVQEEVDCRDVLETLPPEAMD